MDPIQEMADRLIRVDWDDVESALPRARSRDLLMREYLRRTAWWAHRLDAGVGWPSGWPMFDIASLIAPDVRAAPAVLEQVDGAQPGWLGRDRFLCRWILHWTQLRHSGVELPDLPDPFEPLVIFYERGAGFSLENGMIDVGVKWVRIGSVRENLIEAPVVELDAAVLNAIDDAAG